MSKKLKSLEEHNKERNMRFDNNSYMPVYNGIACPECGEELVDSKPMEVLASYPPKKNIACMNKKCNYTGYRIA
jgi:C4-type Zn-finger protein